MSPPPLCHAARCTAAGRRAQCRDITGAGAAAAPSCDGARGPRDCSSPQEHPHHGWHGRGSAKPPASAPGTPMHRTLCRPAAPRGQDAVTGQGWDPTRIPPPGILAGMGPWGGGTTKGRRGDGVAGKRWLGSAGRAGPGRRAASPEGGERGKASAGRGAPSDGGGSAGRGGGGSPGEPAGTRTPELKDLGPRPCTEDQGPAAAPPARREEQEDEHHAQRPRRQVTPRDDGLEGEA